MICPNGTELCTWMLTVSYPTNKSYLVMISSNHFSLYIIRWNCTMWEPWVTGQLSVIIIHSSCKIKYTYDIAVSTINLLILIIYADKVQARKASLHLLYPLNITTKAYDSINFNSNYDRSLNNLCLIIYLDSLRALSFFSKSFEISIPASSEIFKPIADQSYPARPFALAAVYLHRYNKR